MYKLLITGANGFIGRNFQRFLQNYDITSITRQICDLTDKSAVDKFFDNRFFDAVIHAAVVGGSRLTQDDSSVLDQNLIMYYNLLSKKNHFKKFIHFGSGAAICNNASPYGLSKYTILKSIIDKPDFYNINIFAVFGEDELDSRFIKTSILQYIQKQTIEIFENKFMDFFYIEDLATLVNYYLKHNDPPKEIDCRYPQSLTLLDIANKINDLASHKVKIVVRKDGLAESYCGTYQNLSIEFVGLDKGIKQVYEFLSAK